MAKKIMGFDAYWLNFYGLMILTLIEVVITALTTILILERSLWRRSEKYGLYGAVITASTL